MWCWFTNFLTLLCTSLSKEPSQWNEILIKGIRMVYCWTFRTLSAFPSDAGQRTQSYLKIRCLDTNVICQSKIISAQDQLNTRILLNCPFDELFSFFSRSLFIHLSFFFFFFPLPNVAWEFCVITLYSFTKLKMVLWKRINKHFPWCLPKWLENLYPHKNLNVDVYSSFIPICQTLEVIKVSFKGWMDKSSVVHLGNGIFFSNKKKWGIKPWKDMEDS